MSIIPILLLAAVLIGAGLRVVPPILAGAVLLLAVVYLAVIYGGYKDSVLGAMQGILNACFGGKQVITIHEKSDCD